MFRNLVRLGWRRVCHRSSTLAVLAAGVAIAVGGCVGTVGDGRGGEGKGPAPGPGGGQPGGGPGMTPGTPGGSPGMPGGGPGNPPPPAATMCRQDQIGISPLRRLTRVEYDNTIRELLGLNLELAKDFSEDERAGAFPSNYFSPISEGQFGQYATAAAAAATGALGRLAQLLPCAPPASAQPAATPSAAETSCAAQFVRQFGRRAYRRPLEDAEVARYEALFRAGRTEAGGSFAGAIELVLQAMFESPHFIYLIEGPGPLTQHQLAARLSYFLWNAPPDARLSTAADAGNLRTVEALRAEARRMLTDGRAQAMIDEFHYRWLALEDLETLEKDPAVFGDFDPVRPAAREEMRRFANFVLGEGGDGRLDTLLGGSFTFANPALARIYGARATGAADSWQRVELDPAQRPGGLLTQVAFLATHGHEGAAPIFRGIAVRENLFCSPLDLPPPGADQNVPPRRPTQTTRQRMEEHRINPSCAACHKLMDVIGYGFEGYDDIGRFRTTENNIPIDDSGELLGTDVDGPFRGPAELSRRLVQSEQVHACLVTQWFRYALGRMESDLDSCALKAVLARFRGAQLRVPELLLALVESDAFRIRRPEEAGK